MKKSWIQALLIGLLSINIATAAPSDAVDQIKTNVKNVLTILKKDNGKNTAQVRAEAERYALPFFDFQRMTALAVGKEWRNATPAQQAALTTEFQNLLIRVYSGNMIAFKTANVNVQDKPIVNNNGREIVVQSIVVMPDAQKPVQMDYTTYQSGNKYRVYNVSVEGASLVTVYRNQFNEEIRKNGIDGLIKQLKDKNAKGAVK